MEIKERPSSPLLAHTVWVPSPFKTPHICGWLLPETSYLHSVMEWGSSVGDGDDNGEWRSRYWEIGDEEQCEKNGLTVAGRYNTDQCAQAWSLWVHICGVCRVLIDFLQICLEVLCALCESCVVYHYSTVHVCMCVSICAGFHLRQISWTSLWPLIIPASLPDFSYMTFSTRDGVEWKIERQGWQE